MSTRDPLIALRIPPALDARLRSEVAASGVTLSEFVRVALEARLDPPASEPFVSPRKIERKYGYQPVTTQPPPTRAPKKPPRPRASTCEHRVRVGNYCRQCDRVVP